VGSFRWSFACLQRRFLHHFQISDSDFSLFKYSRTSSSGLDVLTAPENQIEVRVPLMTSNACRPLRMFFSLSMLASAFAVYCQSGCQTRSQVAEARNAAQDIKQGALNQADADPLDSGIDSGVYTNHFFGFSLKYPRGWALVSAPTSSASPSGILRLQREARRRRHRLQPRIDYLVYFSSWNRHPRSRRPTGAGSKSWPPS